MLSKAGWQVVVLVAMLGLSGVEAKLKDAEFGKLLNLFRKDGHSLSGLNHDQFHLLFQDVTSIEWNSPESIGTPTTSFQNETYNVVIYHVPPFVEIEDKRAQGNEDPGNLNQSRTIENGKISGLTIDLLAQIQEVMGVQFNLYYPCNKALYATNGQCDEGESRSASAARTMLTTSSPESAAFFGGGPSLCQGLKCFSAGAHKINEDLLRNFFVTQPYMETGFKIVALSQPPEAEFMSWAFPFHHLLWILTLVEVLVVGLVFMVIEGYGANDMLPSNPIGLFLESFYWSFTIVLGVADKQPATHAGRTLVMAQLFFTLILVSVYTGNINSFLLNVPTVTAVDRFDDFINVEADKYNPNNIICYTRNQLSIKTFLDAELGQNQEAAFETIEEQDIRDCMMKVYRGEATATFFDAPIVRWRIKENFWLEGMCGSSGGYCTDPDFNSKDDCLCPAADADGNCVETANEWTSVSGSLVTAGEVFNSFGYALIFPRSENQQVLHHIAFSQAVQFVKENGDVSDLVDKWIPAVADLKCAASGASDIQLSVVNVQGLLTVTAIAALVGLIIGLVEHFIHTLVKFCPCCKALEDALEEMEAETARAHGYENHHYGERSDVEHENSEEQIKKKHLQDGELPPPPEIPPPFPELSVIEALLELQARLDRIEDLLERAAGEKKDSDDDVDPDAAEDAILE